MDKEELKLRTKTFGLRVMKLVRAMPKDVVGRALANQFDPLRHLGGSQLPLGVPRSLQGRVDCETRRGA